MQPRGQARAGRLGRRCVVIQRISCSGCNAAGCRARQARRRRCIEVEHLCGHSCSEEVAEEGALRRASRAGRVACPRKEAAGEDACLSEEARRGGAEHVRPTGPQIQSTFPPIAHLHDSCRPLGLGLLSGDGQRSHGGSCCSGGGGTALGLGTPSAGRGGGSGSSLSCGGGPADGLRGDAAVGTRRVEGDAGVHRDARRLDVDVREDDARLLLGEGGGRRDVDTRVEDSA